MKNELESPAAHKSGELSPDFLRVCISRRLVAGTLCSIAIVLAIYACAPPKAGLLDIRGRTMGTSYRIRIAPNGQKPDMQALRARIQGELNRLDNSLSNWKPRSEISRFNADRSGRPFRFSHPAASSVIKEALEIARLTGGAFDPTVSGLVELWGFGARERRPGEGPPSKQAVESMLKHTGFASLQLSAGSLRKTNPETTINLSAIAKGHAVDLVFELLKNAGHTAVMVEIGGEVRVGLPAPGREHWRIGIETPSSERGNRSVYDVAHLKHRAMATSGDYRNFFKTNTRHFSHIIDPRTGRPTRSRVVSATIIGPSCSRADAFATAMLVMGVDKGLRFIKTQPGYEALLLVRTSDGKSGLREFRTPGMPRYLRSKLR